MEELDVRFAPIAAKEGGWRFPNFGLGAPVDSTVISGLDRQPDVVLGDAGLRGSAGGDVVELRHLHRAVQTCHHPGNGASTGSGPPKPLCLPRARQRPAGVAGECRLRT